MENQLKSDRKGCASEKEKYVEHTNVDVTRIHHTRRLGSIIFNSIWLIYLKMQLIFQQVKKTHSHTHTHIQTSFKNSWLKIEIK